MFKEAELITLNTITVPPPITNYSSPRKKSNIWLMNEKGSRNIHKNMVEMQERARMVLDRALAMERYSVWSLVVKREGQ